MALYFFRLFPIIQIEVHMRLFLLPSSFSGQEQFTLSGKEFNYLIRSLRLKTGQKVMGRDKDGGLWDLEIINVEDRTCTVSANPAQEAVEHTDALPQVRPLKPIILYQCLPKGRKADDIIKKATEIGATAVVLVKSRNCVANLEGKEDSRLSRYDALIKEAIQQSGSLVPTKVFGVIDIKDVPGDLKKRSNGGQSLGLVLHQCRLKEDQSDLFSCVRGFDGTTGILVGPEGGLTDDECNALLEEGFKAVLLKTNILRCETASIYALGAVQTILETDC